MASSQLEKVGERRPPGLISTARSLSLVMSGGSRIFTTASQKISQTFYFGRGNVILYSFLNIL